MSKTLIPSELYVTYKPDNIYDSEAQESTVVRLGFMSPHGDDAAAKKRKATQDKWAYGDVTFDPVTNKGSRRVRGDYDRAKSAYNYTYEPVPDEYHPEVLKNELLEGYQIARSVRRGGWNGGNIVWRIVDPRGFELEISSANFARIVDCTVVDHGVIQGKCVWGRNGSENILLPEGSDVYQAAVARTDRSTSRVPLSSVNPGDVIDVYSSGGADGHGIYLGRHHISQPWPIYRREYESPTQSLRMGGYARHQDVNVGLQIREMPNVDDATDKTKPKPYHRHLVLMLDTNTIHSLSSITVSSIVTPSTENLSALDAVHEYAGHPVKSSTWDAPRWLFVADPKPIKHDQMELVLLDELTDQQQEEWFANSVTSRPPLIVEYQGETWMTAAAYNRSSSTYAPYQIIAKVKVDGSAIHYTEMVPEVAALFGGAKSKYVIQEISDTELATLPARRLAIKYKDKVWPFPPCFAPYLFSYSVTPNNL